MAIETVTISNRDIELLIALDRCVLTPEQLFRLSCTFKQPFADISNLRRRLRKLRDSGLIRCFPYALTDHGKASFYWKLTREGYRVVYDQKAALPKRTYFDAIRAGHHYHSFCVAEVLIHLLISAKRNNCEIVHVARENSVKFEVDVFTLYPDLTFVVADGDMKSFPFVLELDNGTERIRSKQDVESIERKLRGYDAHQARYDKFDKDRYLVIFIATRSKLRLENILQTAGSIMSQTQRRVFIGATLQELLAVDPFKTPVFTDHRGLKRNLIPMPSSEHSNNPGNQVTA